MRKFIILWAIPFVSFLVGYIVTYSFMHKGSVPTPSIIGKPVQEALEMLSQDYLSMRILRVQEDPLLPTGIIIDQLPRPGQKIRINQNVFITVTKSPTAQQVPNLIGQKYKAIQEIATKQGFDIRPISIQSPQPAHTCIAQSPQAGTVLGNKKLFIYLSAGNQSIKIMPSLTGSPVPEVAAFLKKEGIYNEIFHSGLIDEHHECTQCHVVDQRPVAGSFIDTSKPLHVQIQVSG